MGGGTVAEAARSMRMLGDRRMHMKKLVLVAAVAVIIAIVVRLMMQRSGGDAGVVSEADVQIIET